MVNCPACGEKTGPRSGECPFCGVAWEGGPKVVKKKKAKKAEESPSKEE